MNTFGIVKIDRPALREEIYSVLRDVFTLYKSSPGVVVNLRGQGDFCSVMAIMLRHLAVRHLMAEGALIDCSFNYVVMQNLAKLTLRSEKKTR